MTFHVIDKRTGKKPTQKSLNAIMEEAGLIHDADGFAIREDGELLLCDSDGNTVWVDSDNYKVIFDHSKEDERNHEH